MKIAVLLSGGVDSSVALRRLLAEGHTDVTAFYLKVWLEDDSVTFGSCPWEEDLRYARAVCESLGVPLEIVPLQREYLERVVSYTLAELRAGRSPSPDIFCNQQIKFGAFWEKIDPAYERIATGHYARVEPAPDRARLLKGVDRVKDQTYFLSHLRQEQVARSLFPLGGLEKQDVRRLATEYGLPTQKRRDSQGICFLGKIRYNDFVRHHLGEREGAIVEMETGRRLGRHRGFWFHTIGQRKGLGLSGGPWFVTGKDLEENIVFVSHQDHHAERSRRRFPAVKPHWIGPAPDEGRYDVKIRHSEVVYGCTLRFEAPDRLHLELDEDDPGIAPGQFAVIYRGEECLGGATIA